ncbi:fibronectin type III domain-containing protein [Aquimarina mytili]|uniref:Fibronectin type-III domain-containing protein n=1 Tax=Aquimarina mytili TaxID=874423 RepID=A0A936ZX85_9FLAO|nr:hypothetical protein [Aquimarina mytili]MBL0683931.1 hypothetical protein [Aquimarina mytili]
MKRVKKYIIALVSVVLVLSCSSDDDGAPVSLVQNEAPTIPKLVFPTNNLTCASIDLEFAWNTATDADGDTVSYVIEIAATDSFATVLFTAVTTDAKKVFDLEQGITYYWRVKARDDKGNDSVYSEVQSFFTEPEAAVNTIPTAPELVSPGLGDRVSGTTITLDWEASDADNDSLSYDVYFGAIASPTLIEEDITASELEITVSPSTIYYWRVVVKDSNQNAAMSQVWNFRTE